MFGISKRNPEVCDFLQENGYFLPNTIKHLLENHKPVRACVNFTVSFSPGLGSETRGNWLNVLGDMQSSKESQSLYQRKMRFAKTLSNICTKGLQRIAIPLENENPSRQNLKQDLHGGPVSAVLEPSFVGKGRIGHRDVIRIYSSDSCLRFSEAAAPSYNCPVDSTHTGKWQAKKVLSHLAFLVRNCTWQKRSNRPCSHITNLTLESRHARPQRNTFSDRGDRRTNPANVESANGGILAAVFNTEAVCSGLGPGAMKNSCQVSAPTTKRDSVFL